jgi:poly-beta-1,6-N-acetyl-D-glucosamine synthase
VIWLFWVSAIVVAYAFVGYPALIWFLARLSPKPAMRQPMWPSVSILMAVHNGGDALSAKLENLLALNYPKDRLEIVVVSDGSTDGTVQTLAGSTAIKTVLCPRVGKAEALNRALAASNNEIVVFTDVRQQIEPDAIAELVSNFADDNVGCVSGELMFRSATLDEASGISAYWRTEKLIRKCESASGSVVGATGALYAARRALIPSLPMGTLLDDVYIPLHIMRQGRRVVFEPKARVLDEPPQCTHWEFQRKVRTLAGNIQLLELAPWAITDRAVRFRFFSHKLVRIFAPWLLLVMLFSAWALAGSTFYLTLAVLQSLLYGIAAASAFLPAFRSWSVADSALAFCLVNLAAAAAPLNYARYRRNPTRIWRGGGNAVAIEASGIRRAMSRQDSGD